MGDGKLLCYVSEFCQLQVSYCPPNYDAKHQVTVLSVSYQYNRRKWFEDLNLASISNFSKFWRKGVIKMSNDECSGVGVQRAMGHPPFYTSLTFAPAPPTQITQQA